MSTIEIGSSVLRDIASLLNDEESLLKLQRYIRQLKRNRRIERGAVKNPPCCYTSAELTEHLQQGVREARQGMGQSTDELIKEAEAW